MKLKPGWLRAVLGYGGLIFFALVFAVPLLYMIVTSLTPNETELLRNMAGIRAFFPSEVGLDNYRDVMARMPFGRYLLNSVIIVGTTVAAGLLVNSAAAFALARFRWRYGPALTAIVVALMVVPFEAVAVPLLLLVNRLGWLNSYQVQIVPFVANPFFIYLFYQFFLKFPRDLEEAAFLDGAGWFRIYWQIALPLSGPIISSVAILQFLWQWGAFLWPLMVTRGPEYRPLTVGMQVFFGQHPRHWGDIMAFATMMTVPVLILFAVLQRRFVASVAESGMK